MAYQHFLILLLVIADCSSLNQSERVIGDHLSGNQQQGYFIKTVKEESDREKTTRDAPAADKKNFEFRSGILPKTDLTGQVTVPSLDPRAGRFDEYSVGRGKNDSVLLLSIASTARQECLEGYAADENGVCQKTIAGKGKKSFKLRRRKREGLVKQKPSYADVVKFGSLTVPFKSEILTTTPRSLKVNTNESSVTTTVNPVPPGVRGVTSPTAATVPSNPQRNHVTGKVTNAGTTLRPPSQSILPVGKVSETPAAVNPGELVATTVSSVKQTVKNTITTTSQPGTMKGVATSPSVTHVKKVVVTTSLPPAKPTASTSLLVPTKSSGPIIPSILTKIPNQVKSVLGDINKAFLSSEKQSISAQNFDSSFSATTGGRKSPDAARLRRWIYGLSE